MDWGKGQQRTEFLRTVDLGVFTFVVVTLLIRATWSVDATWDTLNYHLPFAARRIGLVTKDEYRFTGWLELCYQGFPQLPYYLYGALWWLTGSAASVNLVSGAVFAGYCAGVARFCRVPLVVVGAAIAAIPVIHVNLTSAYLDLTVNLLMAGALLLGTAIVVEPAGAMIWRLLGGLALLAVAANVKPQFVPIAPGILVAFVLVMVSVRRDGRSLWSRAMEEFRSAGLVTSCAALLVLCLCFATALKNAYFHANPLFPIGFSGLGWRFPGLPVPEYPDPRYLRGGPQVVRWAFSVLEYRAFDFRPTLYSVGQGDVPSWAPSLRMGGYMALLVVYNLFVFFAATLARGGAYRFVAAAFIVLTGVVACLPGSHELRYYSFWVVYLVTMNVALLWRWGDDPVERRHFSYVAIAAFVFVTTATGLQYVLPPPRTLGDLVTALRLDRNFVRTIEDGETYCLVHWEKLPLLVSPLLHREHAFRIIEGDGGNCPPEARVVDYRHLR